MLRDGRGVGCDLPRALKYIMKAAASDYKDSRMQVKALEEKGVALEKSTKSTVKSGAIRPGNGKSAAKGGKTRKKSRR